MDLSYIELDLVEKLRNRISDVVPTKKLQDDHFLVCWLRARDLDIEKAECMLRKSMEWLEKSEMDTILDFPPRISNYRFTIAGHDAEGCPVICIPIGLWNVHEIKEKDLGSAYRFFVWMLARMEYELEKSSKRLGKPVTHFVLIADYQQLAYFRCLNNRHLIKFGLELLALFEANFPERLKSCTIINTARMFPLIFKMAKPFLSAKTLSKIEIHGSQRKKWIAAFEKKVPMEILPPYYGGTRRGIDDFCSDDTDMWNYGEPLPANYYGTNNGRFRKFSTVDLEGQREDDLNIDGDGWTTEEIKAGSYLDIEMAVSMDICVSTTLTLHWWVQSEGYDIGMKVVFRPVGQNVTREIVGYRRIDAHLTTHSGNLICEMPGIYVLVLDNSYSRRRNKMVSYNVRLVKQEADNTDKD